MPNIRRRSSILLVLVSLLVCVLPVVSSAGTLEVTEDGSGLNSIQEAAERAESGDTILVGSGRYEENVSIDKNLTLKAKDPGKARVDGSAKGKPTLRIGPSEISATLVGLTVEGAEGKLCHDRSEGVCPDGLLATGKSSVRVENSSFLSNEKNGIRVNGSARVSLEGSEIKRNERAGLRVTESGEATIEEARTSNNRNGVYLDRSARVEVSNSDVRSSSGYGLRLFGKSRLKLETSLVAENGKGGLHFENSSQGIVRKSSITENEGRGVLAQSSAKVTLERNEVKGNAIGLTSHTEGKVTFSENEISGNTVDLVGDLSGSLRKKLNPETREEITLPSEEYPGLQAAVDALQPGGAIFLVGEVSGHAVVDKELSLVASGEGARISPEGKTVAPLLSLVHGAEVEVEGLGVGDSGGSGAVLGGNARLDATRATFEANSEEGLGLWNSARLRLERSRVRNNDGSGVRLVGSARLEAATSQLSGNGVENVLLAGTSSAEVEFSRIADGKASGFSLHDSASLTVERSEISANGMNGLELTASSEATVVKCKLADNEVDGASLYSSAELEVKDSRILNNSSGISLRDASELVAEKSSFRGNDRGINAVNPKKFQGGISGTGNVFSGNDSDFSGVKEAVREKLTD